jgi:hypothetical protein
MSLDESPMAADGKPVEQRVRAKRMKEIAAVSSTAAITEVRDGSARPPA